MKLKTGEYEPRIVKKGYDEAFIKELKEGDVFYAVKLDKYTTLDVKTQTDAVIISTLVRIEKRLKKLK